MNFRELALFVAGNLVRASESDAATLLQDGCYLIRYLDGLITVTSRYLQRHEGVRRGSAITELQEGLSDIKCFIKSSDNIMLHCAMYDI